MIPEIRKRSATEHFTVIFGICRKVAVTAGSVKQKELASAASYGGLVFQNSGHLWYFGQQQFAFASLRVPRLTRSICHANLTDLSSSFTLPRMQPKNGERCGYHLPFSPHSLRAPPSPPFLWGTSSSLKVITPLFHRGCPLSRYNPLSHPLFHPHSLWTRPCGQMANYVRVVEHTSNTK